MAVITITENSQNLKTIFPNGNIIRDQNLPVANSEMFNAIGEKKRWTIDYTSDTLLEGNTIYINPALFIASGGTYDFLPPGANYWSYVFPNSFGGVMGVTYECALSVSGLINPKIQKNYRVAVRVNTPYTFTVFIEFYMTYDDNGFLNPMQHSNVNRFFKDIKSNSETMARTDSDSVYTSETRSAKLIVMLKKENGVNGYIVTTTNFKGIFYGEGSITNGLFVMKRDGVVVETLSTAADTDVEFYIDAAAPDTIQYVTVWIVKVSEDNPEKDFLENYDADWKLILAGSADSSKIIGPFTSPQLMGGGTYRSTFKIKGSSLEIGARYRLIGHAYAPIGVSSAVGIGTSDPVDVADSPCFDGTGFVLTGRLSDYNVEFSGDDLEACIEERMRSTIQMQFNLDQWKNYLLTRLGIVGTNDIRRYLTQVTCTIYRESVDASSNVIKHIYAQGTVNKLSPVLYSGSAGIASDFPNNGSASFTFDWRNRYESATLNLQSTINGIVVTPFDNQYWGGKAFLVEWEFKFIYDDYPAPFTDLIRYTQKLSVKDYVIPPTMTLLQDNDTPESVDICYGSNLCLKATSPDLDFDGIGDNMNLISTIEVAPGNVAVIEEAEAWVGNELAQLTTDKIYNQDAQFAAGVAKFCIDTTKLSLNLPYKITAIAKPISNSCRRTTEIYDPRKTEIGEQRVPESCFN